MTNILCYLGLHKWIGAHTHDGYVAPEDCLAGCICTRCGYKPRGEKFELPVVKGDIQSIKHENKNNKSTTKKGKSKS